MRRRLLVALCAALFIPAPVLAAPPPTPLGTITLDNVPAYHQAASFHWTFNRKPRWATLGVFCQQQIGSYVYIAELAVPQDPTGSGSVVIDNETSSAVPGTIDYTRPSECQAYLWDERLAEQGKPSALTVLVEFTIPPEV